MTPEIRLSNLIRIECGVRNWLCFHINVGTVRTADGRYFQTGVPEGYPDLTIITDHGIIFFVETKIKPRKPTAKQLEFIADLHTRGFVAEVIYSIEAFVELANSLKYIINTQ